jgi:hypothetical protein
MAMMVNENFHPRPKQEVFAGSGGRKLPEIAGRTIRDFS